MLLKIFDVSPMIYAGHYGLSKNGFTANANTFSNGLPIGGVRYLMRTAVAELCQDSDILFVFDSKTDKSELYDGYKATRTHNPDIFVQQQMVEDIARNSNIPFLKRDNYEADDLVAYAVSQLKSQYSVISIVTTDMDLAANIVDKHIYIDGANSSTPTVNADNYSWVIKNGTVIPYNAILPYYMFYGKPSNNVKPFRSKKINTELFTDFIDSYKNTQVPQSLWSSYSVFTLWLDAYYPEETEDKLELLNRAKYVYPRPIDEPLAINCKNCIASLYKEQLAFFLKTFNLDTCIEMLNLQQLVSATRTKEMFNYESSYKQAWQEGTLGVDKCGTADGSLFPASLSGDTTRVFATEEDF